MKRTPVDWIAALVFVFLAVFAFAEFMLEGEQRHRAEVAEARADSLAMAKRDTIYVEPLSPDGQFLMVPLDSIAYIGKVSVAVRWPKHRGVCDSLAHLADSLRDRRNYWYWRAHLRARPYMKWRAAGDTVSVYFDSEPTK